MTLLALAARLSPQADWRATGHRIPGETLVLLGRIGVIVIGVLYAALLVRALARSRRYRASGVIGEQDLAALRAELAAAERKTAGELAAVVLERSDAHPGALWLAALAFLLLGSGLAAPVLPWQHPWLVLAAQLAMLALGYATARWLPDFQRLFVSEPRATLMAEEQALQEFYRHGLHRTAGRTGVLVFVSLLERRAIVLGDEGIDARVGEEHWKRATEAILAGVAAGSLRDGLVEGIRACGAVLAEHFPRPACDPDEIPDRVIVRRE
jgi:putative membrane protein